MQLAKHLLKSRHASSPKHPSYTSAHAPTTAHPVQPLTKSPHMPASSQAPRVAPPTPTDVLDEPLAPPPPEVDPDELVCSSPDEPRPASSDWAQATKKANPAAKKAFRNMVLKRIRARDGRHQECPTMLIKAECCRASSRDSCRACRATNRALDRDEYAIAAA